jgi:hypothetical protein
MTSLEVLLSQRRSENIDRVMTVEGLSLIEMRFSVYLLVLSLVGVLP